MPTWRLGLDPLGIDVGIVAHINGRGCPLEDMERLRACSQMRHALNSGCTCTDDSHTFVHELIEVAKRTAAGVIVIPPTGVEGMTRVGIDTGYARQLRTIQWGVEKFFDFSGTKSKIFACGGPLTVKT